MDKRTVTTAVFYTLLLTPALLLLLLVVLVGIDLFALRSVDADRIYNDVQAAIPQRSPVSFPPPPDIFLRPAGKTTVFAFGASSLVLSDGRVFPEYLGEIHKDLHVVNFGISAIDSLSVRLRVQEALTAATPDVLLLYFGHNDYNRAYQYFILPRYFEKFDSLLRLAYLFYDSDRPAATFADGAYDVFARLNRPKLYKVFEQWGLVTVDQQALEPVNGLILAQYLGNLEAILDMAASRGIPVVLITPVGNLHAEPYGDLRTTTAYYRKGMGTQDYKRSLEYLRKARDTEVLTYDLRAKSALLDALRSVKRDNVYVLDLERVLEERHFGFGNDDFVDYFHFNDRSHRLLAGIIYDFMRAHGLVGQRQRSLATRPGLMS